MTGRKHNFWTKILRHFRTPSFQETLEESERELRSKPIHMRCPTCGETVPFAERCANCGRPRHPSVDRHI